MKAWLDAGVAVDATTKSFSALGEAVRAGDMAMVKLLLARGADINFDIAKGFTHCILLYGQDNNASSISC